MILSFSPCDKPAIFSLQQSGSKRIRRKFNTAPLRFLAFMYKKRGEQIVIWRKQQILFAACFSPGSTHRNEYLMPQIRATSAFSTFVTEYGNCEAREHLIWFQSYCISIRAAAIWWSGNETQRDNLWAVEPALNAGFFQDYSQVIRVLQKDIRQMMVQV